MAPRNVVRLKELAVHQLATNVQHVTVKLCLQPMVSGRCFGYVESYAYNPLERRCEAFIYGGCGGNENRFDSKAVCEYACRDV